jgi:hydrogenase maturation protease
MTRLALLAWGNPSRGDDALGPAFLEAAMSLPRATVRDIAYVTDFQLQPEHAVDLVGRDLALFVDASTAAAAPFSFHEVTAARDRTFTTHAMSPAAVLATYAAAFHLPPPPAFTLAIRGDSFRLGEPIGAAAAGRLRDALAFFEALLADVAVSAWRDAALARSRTDVAVAHRLPR